MYTLAFLILSTIPINGEIKGLSPRETEKVCGEALNLFQEHFGQSITISDTLNLKSTAVWKLNQLFPHNGLIAGNYNRETHTVWVAEELGDTKCTLFHETMHFLFHTSGMSASTDNDGEHKHIHIMEKLWNPKCEKQDGS